MAKKSKNKTVKKPVDKKPTENPATIVKPANAADETPIEEIVAEEMPASDTQASEKPDTAPKENPADKTPTPKKEEKPANKDSKKENASKQKAEVIKPVVNKGMSDTQFRGISDGLSKMVEGERLSADSIVTLASLISNDYKNNPNCPPELQNAMSQSCDMMVLRSTMVFHKQLQNDMAESGIKVSNEVFDRMSRGFVEYFGTRLIGLPAPDGQTVIDFKETMENAPSEVQKAVDAETKVIIVEDIPAFVSGKSEEDYIKDIRSILAMKNRGKEVRGMEQNISDAMAYAKSAFCSENAEPAQVLATLITKLGDEKPCLLITGCARAVYGQLQETQSIFGSHSWIKSKLFPTFDDAKISNVVKVLLSYCMKIQSEKTGSKYEDSYLTPWSKLLSSCNEGMIDQIITGNATAPTENITFKDGEKPLAIDGLSMSPVSPVKIVNYLKLAYGSSLSDNILKNKMQHIMALYSEPLHPLSVYVEKSDYVSK